MTDDQVITLTELDEALRAKVLDGRGYPSKDIEALALIYDYALAHREPSYKDGAFYQDAYGEVWRYFAPDPGAGWADPVWNACGDANTYAFSVPKRPLAEMRPVATPADGVSLN